MADEYRCRNVDTHGPASVVSSSDLFVPNMAFSRDSCSDNDSGICLDSSSEQSCSSPNCSTANVASTERSRIFTKNNSGNIPTLIPSLKTRREGRSRSQTRTKPMRVRFADEVSLDTCSNTFVIESSVKQTKPPPYNVAVRRRFQEIVCDEYSNSDNYAALLRAKSSDLAKSIENLSLLPASKIKLPIKTVASFNKNHSSMVSSTSAPSKIYSEQFIDTSKVGIREIDTKNSQKNQSRPKFNQTMTPALQKLANSGTHPESVCFAPANFHKPANVENERPFVNKDVKARLLSIDSKGIHAIELKKTEDGPFGFYISTGTYKNKKGVFVSRVNVRNLNLLLNVGDQILEIDNTPTKGRSLEQTQMMMFNKNQVVLKILPVSSSVKRGLII